MKNGADTAAEINGFEFNNVLRDGVQSNQGTNLSAEEIIDMLLHTTEAEYAEYQIAGGTFMDLFLKKGRDAFGENAKLFEAFEDVITSALIRGDCLTAYNRQPQDVIDAVIEELADRGLNVVTNFHGLNYAPMQEGVFKAVQKAQDKDYEIEAPKVLCIEDNPNITIEGCMAALEQQDAMGADAGIYLKNASGKVDPDFVYELTKRVAEKYPGQKITIHAHDNHGLADAIYMRAAEAGAETNAKIAFDVLPTAMASGTAQPPAWRIEYLLKNHPSEKVRARATGYDEAKEAKDAPKQYAKRHQYGSAEVRYSKKAWDACYEAGMAGGAMAAIKGMGLPKDVKTAYKMEDEDEALAFIATIESEIKVSLGYPVNVTPYQKMMDELAGFEALWRKMPNDQIGKAPIFKDTVSVDGDDNREGAYNPFSRLTPAAVNYLSGGLGAVPNYASARLINASLAARGLDAIEEFVPADQLPPGMDAAKEKLEAAGYKDPETSDVALTAMFGAAAFKEVMIRSGMSNLPEHHEKNTVFKKEGYNWITQEIKGSNVEVQGAKLKPTPAQPPEWPAYLQKPSEDHSFGPESRTVTQYDVATALGGAAGLEKFSLAVAEMEKHADGFYKTGIGATGFFKRSLEGQKLSRQFDQERSDVRASKDYLVEVQQYAKARAEQEAGTFMEAIPEMLKEYGMTQKQAAAASTVHVRPLLEQIVDKKAKGASTRTLSSMKVGSVPEAFEAERLNGATNGAARKGGSDRFMRKNVRSGGNNWIAPNEPEPAGQQMFAAAPVPGDNMG